MKHIVTAAVVLLLGTHAAQAGTVVATFNSTSGGTLERIIEDSTVGSTGWTGLNAGSFSFTRTGGTATEQLLPGIGGSFLTFCVEAQETITQGQSYTFEVKDLSEGAENIGGMGVVRSNQLRELLYGVKPLQGMSTVQAAALQVAMWEIVRETSALPYDVLNGKTRFRNAFDGAVFTTAQGWLDSFVNDGEDPTQRAGNVVALVNANNQDVIGFSVVPDGGASLTLLGSALLGLGTLRRKLRI
ncbi:hypothetical protein [Luteitalea sp.]|jgi:hypothetical protein|uniref:hypothetical protein n=1 Tax=Luteitalea sp. TaxID=2004800 RepID=UPI0037CA6F55